MPHRPTKPVSSAPEYRGRSLSTRDQIEQTATVVETDGGLLATYRMSGCWFWRSRGGGWFELMEKRDAVGKLS